MIEFIFTPKLMGGYITGDGGGMVNFRHGGGQGLMGGELALLALDGGGVPPHPPPYWETLGRLNMEHPYKSKITLFLKST